jgi:hypothetical protein
MQMHSRAKHSIFIAAFLWLAARPRRAATWDAHLDGLYALVVNRKSGNVLVRLRGN